MKFKIFVRIVSHFSHFHLIHQILNQEYEDLNQVMIFPILFLLGNMNFNIIDEIYTNFEFSIQKI